MKKCSGNKKDIHSHIQPHPRIALTILFSIIVFCILTITMMLLFPVALVMEKVDFLANLNIGKSRFIPILGFAILSIAVGTSVAAIVSSIPLKPVNELIEGMNRLASGDFTARLDMGKNRIGSNITESFNALANELDNTEMLRADFVNNFSHEFKTPIVSIKGFSQVLLKGNLTQKQQTEYLEIIYEEATRLADMSTNILNLTKIENQTILTDTSVYNLAEQIRRAILLLESKWQNKNITINADFDEVKIQANEELMSQVWINIIDNAIKFSPQNGEIMIKITTKDNLISVSIINNGPKIEENEKKRIFNKYWQADTSHTSEGTGIGLSIVKSVVKLHNGNIDIDSNELYTTFTINLPN